MVVKRGFETWWRRASGSSYYFNSIASCVRPGGPIDHQKLGKLGKLNRYTCRIRTRIALLVYQIKHGTDR